MLGDVRGFAPITVSRHCQALNPTNRGPKPELTLTSDSVHFSGSVAGQVSEAHSLFEHLPAP